ncbi:MAG: OB-fold nucleic acid binding domain-containing protein [Methanosarcinaceae archaeon]|nr:OB-fold nucleic acid binding domain-containing protein [Methanosarcinaceae archaeon]MDD4496721.1 OB-fold nucleic acid binding domain-containing protein [Methanosarcinaceae archaeon]
MEKEEKIVVALILMALSSLSVAYFCFGSGPACTGSEAEELTAGSALGDRVFLEAEVMSKRFTYKGGHLLLRVDHESEVFTVFVPEDVGVEALDKAIDVGDYVAITGTLEEYEGGREIKILNKGDIRVLQQSKGIS